MNPLREVCISDELVIPLGSVSDPVVALMNETLRLYAKLYGCVYVDVTNGESVAVKEELNISEIGQNALGVNFIKALAAIHPTPETMDYIAKEDIQKANFIPKKIQELQIIILRRKHIHFVH